MIVALFIQRQTLEIRLCAECSVYETPRVVNSVFSPRVYILRSKAVHTSAFRSSLSLLSFWFCLFLRRLDPQPRSFVTL